MFEQYALVVNLKQQVELILIFFMLLVGFPLNSGIRFRFNIFNFWYLCWKKIFFCHVSDFFVWVEFRVNFKWNFQVWVGYNSKFRLYFISYRKWLLRFTKRKLILLFQKVTCPELICNIFTGYFWIEGKILCLLSLECNLHIFFYYREINEHIVML